MSIERKNVNFRTAALAAAALAGLGIGGVAQAATVVWNGSAADSNFETGGNWGGSNAPSSTLTFGTTGTTTISGTSAGDIASLPTPLTATQPQLTISRSIQQLLFNSSGWTIGSSSTANSLTLGTGGISSNVNSGINTVTANLNIASGYTATAATTLLAGSGAIGTNQLVLTGNITAGASGAPVLASIAVGSSTRLDTVLINPSPGNSVNLYLSTSQGTAGGLLAGAGGGTLILGGTGANATSSTNVISNTIQSGSTGQPASLRYQSGGTLQVNSGTWITNDFGGNNSNTATGTLNITGGTVKTGAAKFIVNGGGVATMTGGTLQVTNAGGTTNSAATTSSSGTFGIGGNGSSTLTATFNLVAGTIDVAKVSINNSNSSIGGAANGLMNQSGGSMTVGVSNTTNVFSGAVVDSSANAFASDLGIGSNTAGVSAAYTLGGGTLTVAGTIKGPTGTTGSFSNFNFKAGTLAAGKFDATRLGSNSAATVSSNQIAASSNIGTLENYGGTVAPGGVAASGLMSVTGSYAGNGSGSTLSFDLGGTTAAAAFAGATGSFDNIAVSGTTSLNDVLAVNLLAGYTPTNTDTFTILSSTGTLSGTFSNVAFGSTLAVNGGTFDVNQVSNTVVLSNFQAVPEPTALAALGLIGITALRRRQSR